MTTVSVILTSYNKPQWIGQAIESVLNQTFTDLALFIMEDNSSKKEVLEVIKEYESDPRVSVYHSKVEESERPKLCRYAYLINFAVHNFVTSKYITYLADDDIFYVDRLERMIRFLEETGHNVVYGNQDIADINMTIRGQRGPFGVLDSAWNLIDHNSVLHTREVFDMAGGWDDNPGTWGGSDSYFWNRITEAGYKFYPLEGHSTDAKRYHEDSIQWLMANNKFFF